MAAVPEAAVSMTRDREAAMGRHGRGILSHGATNAAACPGRRGTQHSLWKSSWQMLATAGQWGDLAGVWACGGGGGIHESFGVQNPFSLVEVLGLLSGHTLVLPTGPRDVAHSL